MSVPIERLFSLAWGYYATKSSHLAITSFPMACWLCLMSKKQMAADESLHYDKHLHGHTMCPM